MRVTVGRVVGLLAAVRAVFAADLSITTPYVYSTPE